MTTGSIQVHPTNALFRMNNPPGPPIQREQSLRAKRCLFGPSNPEATSRLLREELDTNYQCFRARYQIIDRLCIHSNGQLASVDIGEETVNAVENASNNPSNTRTSPAAQSEQIAPRNLSDTRTSPAAQSEQIAPRNPSADRRVHRNPGPLRYFAVRRHYEPYARKVEEESRITGV